MTRSGLPAVGVAWFVLGIMAIGPLPAIGQETSGLQAATALEDVLVKAIARSERSVVAIARVSRNGADRPGDAPNLFNRFQPAEIPVPGDLDFIPNDYATGVVVGDGLILTAYHVLRDDSEYWVSTADRKTYKVSRIVGADPRSDLAVLQIAARDLVPIKFGDAGKLKKGQIVIALGNPYSIARDGQVSASWGIVANLSRKDAPVISQRDDQTVPVKKPTLHQYGTLIHTDAKLNLGTSGGALLNLKGEMVGLTVALAASLGYEQSAGFALPVDETFLRAVGTLKQGREVEYGFLGVGPKRLPIDENSHGVLVESVVEGTPAERAGLKPGDLITRIDDQEIYEPDDLMLSIGRLPADGSAQILVERDGRRQVIPVHELAKYYVPGKKIVTNQPPAWRGVRVDYVTASRDFQTQARQHRLDAHGSVLITEVEEDSPAWTEGLRPNMAITHVGGNPVATPKQFREAVEGKAGPVRLRLGVLAADRPERVIPPEAE
jgi:S1-C subfamily serine protease